MYTLHTTNYFDKCLKICNKRHYPMQKLQTALKILVEDGSLPPEYKPHKLSGTLDAQWECHIQGDWLMRWIQNDTELTLLLLATGTHSDMFGKNRR